MQPGEGGDLPAHLGHDAQDGFDDDFPCLQGLVCNDERGVRGSSSKQKEPLKLLLESQDRVERRLGVLAGSVAHLRDVILRGNKQQASKSYSVHFDLDPVTPEKFAWDMRSELSIKSAVEKTGSSLPVAAGCYGCDGEKTSWVQHDERYRGLEEMHRSHAEEVIDRLEVLLNESKEAHHRTVADPLRAWHPPLDELFKEQAILSEKNPAEMKPSSGVLASAWPMDIKARPYDSDPTSSLSVGKAAHTKIKAIYVMGDGHGGRTGAEADKAWDSTVDTFYDSRSANDGWTAADLGMPTVISKIRYIARAGYEERMVGGYFQGCRTLDDGRWTTLHTVKDEPLGDYGQNVVPIHCRTPFRYVRYHSPPGGHCNVTDIVIWGSDPQGDETDAIKQKLTSHFTTGLFSKTRHPCMVRPNKLPRLLWDTTSIMVLLIDLTLLPITTVWDYDAFAEIGMTEALNTFRFCSTCFWVADMLITFRTGVYTQDHILEMRPWRIAVLYLKGRFFVDFIAVGADVASGMLERVSKQRHPSAKIAHIARIFKISRLVRLARIGRLSAWSESGFVTKWKESGWYASFVVLMDIAKSIAVLMYVNHFIGCFWNAVGMADVSDTGLTWHDMSIAPHDIPYRESGFWYQYLTGYHWSLTQMTPGSMQVAPVNSFERCFNLCILFIGLLCFSSIISQLSAKSIQIQNAKKDRLHVFEEVRTYLARSKMDVDVSIKIHRQLQERLSRRRELTFDMVRGFNLISESLKVEARVALFCPLMRSHPFFRACEIIACKKATLLHRIASDASIAKVNITDKALFKAGDPCNQTYIALSGQFVYQWDPPDIVDETQAEGAGVGDIVGPQQTTTSLAFLANTDADDEVMFEVSPGEWLSEAGLWCDWTHVGVLEPLVTGEFISLDCEKFSQALCNHPQMNDCAQAYARSFTQRVNTAVPPSVASWPNDVHVPHSSYEDIVESLPVAAKSYLGMLATAILKSQKDRDVWGGLKRKPNFDKLQDEVQNGKSTMIMTPTGQVLRVVTLVAVRLTREDDRMLVQLGKKSRAAQVKAEVALIARKVKSGEVPHATLERITEGACKPFSGMQFHNSKKEESITPSKSHGVDTKYVKHLYNASIDLRTDETFLSSKLLVSTLQTGSPPEVGGVRTKAKMGSDLVGEQCSLGLSELEVVILPASADMSELLIAAWVLPSEFEKIREDSALLEAIQGIEFDQELLQEYGASPTAASTAG